MTDRELRFSGENRKDALRRLKRAYDDVAAAAEALGSGKRVIGPTYRVVSIEAERGLGKTRLAMELYRHLARHCDPGGYWPEDHLIGGPDVRVMPQAEGFTFSRPMSYLWWGLSVAPAAGVGATLSASFPDLLPHMVSARVAARRRASGRNVLAEMTELAVDLSLPFAEGAMDVAGLGSLKALGAAAFRIGDTLRRGSGGADDVLSEAREPLTSLVEMVMGDLGTLFGPGTRHFAGLPLVVLVDDAQFADRDTAVAGLVERLIARASGDAWPLLLVFTHWSRQMRSWHDAEGRRHGPSLVARVLHHARHGSGNADGQAAADPGGSLPDSAYLRLDLSEPVDALGEALRDQFPGLAPKDVAAISSRAGGNPRKLEQIAARMMRKPRWFETKTTDGPLTDAGRAAVVALADLPILDVVVDRFADTPPDVRRAMMVAGLMGNSFVCSLVERVAQSSFSGVTRDELAAAETTYRFLRDVVDQSRNDTAAFTEQLFREAAEEYRVSGMARADLGDWPEDTTLIAALDRMLDALLDDPNAFGSLSEDDRIEVLSLAAEHPTDASSARVGIALGHLVVEETRRRNADGANDAALRFLNGYPERWGLERLPEDVSNQIALTLWMLEETEGATEIWRDLTDLLRKRSARRRADLDLTRLFLRTCLFLAYAQTKKGATDAAEDAYMIAATVALQIESESPGVGMRAKSNRDRSELMISIGDGLSSWRIVEFLKSLRALRGDVQSLPDEGSLSPGTYRVAAGSARSALLDRMREAHDQALREEWEARDPRTLLASPEEALIIASLVAQEARHPRDRSVYATIFVNRLARSMRLQSDRSVIYGLTGGKQLRRSLTLKDLKSATPYNTYLLPRLPITPIGNVDRQTLHAVLHPLNSRDFFVVTLDSGGAFGTPTLDKHNFVVGVWRSWMRWKKRTQQVE